MKYIKLDFGEVGVIFLLLGLIGFSIPLDVFAFATIFGKNPQEVPLYFYWFLAFIASGSSILAIIGFIKILKEARRETKLHLR